MKTPTQKKDGSARLPINGRQAEPTHEEIALRAYSLWEQQGRPHNQQVAIWLQDETQLRQLQNQHGVQA